MSSAAVGVVAIRPSPQKLSGACVVLTTSPVQVATAGTRPVQQTRRPIQLARDNRRRPGYQSYIPPPQPTNVLRRNARERNRVKQVNHGFAALRNHIPSAAKNKKLSKVDTLRRAVEYIQSLQALLDETDSAALSQTSPPLPQTTTPSSSCSGDSGFAEPAGATAHYLTSPASAGPHTPSSLHHLHSHLSPPCSDASSSSPAPSFTSDQPGYPASDFDTSGYDAYVSEPVGGYGAEPEISPEDEELLDAIAWWQTSQ